MKPHRARSERVAGRVIDLRSLIRVRYRDLPSNQRKIADYLLHNIPEAPFLSVIDLEKRSGTSRATVVRFARSLGFSGFLELRSRLLEGLQSQMSGGEELRLPSARSDRGTLALVAEQDVRNIDQTVRNLDRRTFAEVGAMLVKASRVYSAGLGISSLLAGTLAYLLNQVAVRASSFVHGSATFVEQLVALSPHDVLVVFSFPPYSRETIDLARVASSRKIPVIAITDRLTSPVSFHAVKVLPVRSTNMLFTNSLSAISVVMNALATEIAVRNRDKALRALQQTEKLLRQSGHYTTD